jgi:hypothetical protein
MPDDVKNDIDETSEIDDAAISAVDAFISKRDEDKDIDDDADNTEAVGDEKTVAATGEDDIEPATDEPTGDDDGKEPLDDTEAPTGDDDVPPAQDEPQATEAEPLPQDSKVDDIDFDELFPDDWVDETVKNGVKAVFDSIQEKNNTLQKKLDKLDEYISAQQQKGYVEEFDNRISRLGEDYDELLAPSQRGYELDTKSEAFQNRVKLDEHIRILASGFKSNNKPVPDTDTLFKMALNSLFDVKPTGGKTPPLAQNRPNLIRPSKSTQRQKTADEISLEKANAFVKKASAGW